MRVHVLVQSSTSVGENFIIMFNDICSIISDESTIITEIFMFDIEKSVNIMVQNWFFMEFIRFFFACQ